MAFGSVMVAGLAGAVRAPHRFARLHVVSANLACAVPARRCDFRQVSPVAGHGAISSCSPTAEGGVPCWRCWPFRALLVQPEWLTFDAVELETAGVVGA